MDRQVRVLYLVGWQRSGTTITGNILGSAPNACHIGELAYLFKNEHPAGGKCGCGMLLQYCPIWSQVLEDVGVDWTERTEIDNVRIRAARMRHIPKMLRAWKLTGVIPEYSQLLSRVYSAVVKRSNAEVVIDSSKTPAEGLAAAMAPSAEVKFLHLVRDPRGCAYSTAIRRKRHIGSLAGERMKHKSVALSSVRWTQVNLLTELYIKRVVPPERYMRVRYEDLMANPKVHLQKIAEWTGLTFDDVPVSDSGEATLAPSHTVMGNPNRHVTGSTQLQKDDEWIIKLDRRKKIYATAPALPLLHKYGYGLGTQQP